MKETASVNDIIIRIHTKALEHNIDLTYSNTKVYLKLLDYAKENDNVVDRSGVRFFVSTQGLARYCGVAPRIISESLKKLNECGIINYIPKKASPSTVKLLREYYQKGSE